MAGLQVGGLVGVLLSSARPPARPHAALLPAHRRPLAPASPGA